MKYIILAMMVISANVQAFYRQYDDGCQTINVQENAPLTATSVQFEWSEHPEASRYYFRVYDPSTRMSYGNGSVYTNTKYVSGLPEDGRRLLLYCYNYIGGWQRTIWEVYAYDASQEPEPPVYHAVDTETKGAITDTNETINQVLLIVLGAGLVYAFAQGFQAGLHR